MRHLVSSLKPVTRRLTSLSGFTLLALGLVGSAIWTLLGALISLTTTGPRTFLREWVLLQGPPLLTLGLFLSFFTQGCRLRKLASELGCPVATMQLSGYARIGIIISVTLVGTASLLALGFPARQLTLSFMWLTCLLICLMASLATAHAAEVLLFASKLPACPAKLHSYSPADTPGIRKLAEYVGFFGLIVTIGYCLAFAATIGGNWSSDPHYIKLVRYFWPIIYVPLCLATLLYPHLAIYRRIRSEKDQTISCLQARMTMLSSADESLSKDEIDRLNALADLIQKVESAPNYPRNFSLVGSLAFTLLANMASLLIPKETLALALRSAIGF